MATFSLKGKPRIILPSNAHKGESSFIRVKMIPF